VVDRLRVFADDTASPSGEQSMEHRPSAVRLAGAVATLLLVSACSERTSNPVAPSPDQPASFNNGVSQQEVLSNAVIHRTVQGQAEERSRGAAHGRGGGGGGSNNLLYHGGVGGIGVETAPKVYLVLFGSQWNSNDPSGESAILQSFLGGVGGSGWLNSVTQYCQGVATGTVFCNGAGQAAGNGSGIFAGIWADNASLAPSRPSQSQLAAEAVSAAAHFRNTSAASNASVQYVIATATGNSSSGFGTQYCAYHSSTSSTAGNIAYTNLPYITDAGASCGANFNSLGAHAGITIVEGHELAETISDQFPNGGWLDGGGAENGDKCAWISSGQGASANISLSTGTFPVQSLWSNAFNSNAGGCVLSF
jgi:serine protease